MSNINKIYKNIFIHVPKNAGTSMESLKYVGGDSHATARIMREIVGEDVWKEYVTWGFVREPLDRFISGFFHQPATHAYPLTPSGFRDFVHYMDKFGIDIQGSLDGSGHHHHHFVPQHYFLCNDEGKIIVDYVGRFSRLEEHFEHILKRIAVRPEKLPHDRSSNHGHYSSYYGIDKDLIRIVRRLYKKDYEIFKAGF